MMREYNKANGVRSDRHMSVTEIIVAGDNLREVERYASTGGNYGPITTTILLGISVVGIIVYFIIPIFNIIFN